MHDEMSVRGDLVYDRRGGELIGFTNPQTWKFGKVGDDSHVHYVIQIVGRLNIHVLVKSGILLHTHYIDKHV